MPQPLHPRFRFHFQFILSFCLATRQQSVIIQIIKPSTYLLSTSSQDVSRALNQRREPPRHVPPVRQQDSTGLAARSHSVEPDLYSLFGRTSASDYRFSCTLDRLPRRLSARQ